MQRYINIAANVVLVVACLTIVGTTLLRGRAPRGQASQSLYEMNTQMHQLPGVDYHQADTTLVMFLRSECVFCTKSMPFYRRLGDKRNTAAAAVRLVIAGVESTDVLGSYVRAHGLAADQVVTVSAGTALVTGTPTLVAVNRKGYVASVWVGLLDTMRERELADALFGVSNNR